jgi:hypothetical protein
MLDRSRRQARLPPRAPRDRPFYSGVVEAVLQRGMDGAGMALRGPSPSTHGPRLPLLQPPRRLVHPSDDERRAHLALGLLRRGREVFEADALVWKPNQGTRASGRALLSIGQDRPVTVPALLGLIEREPPV